MASIFTPKSKVRLFENVPLDKSYANTLTNGFNKTTQLNNFIANYSSVILDTLTFTRKESNTIRISRNVETMYHYNYMIFQNENSGNKWFYAFIVEHRYINPNVTELVFEIDVMQTWLTEMKINQSFVQREHCPQSITKQNLNTIPENLEIGTEYETHYSETVYPVSRELIYLVIACTDYITTNDKGETKGGKYSHTIDPLIYYIVPMSTFGKPVKVNAVEQYNYEYIFYAINNEENVNKVASMFYIPFLPFDSEVSSTQTSVNLRSQYLIQEKLIGETTINGISRVNSFPINEETVDVASNRYTLFPSFKEVKMYTYPYSYIEIADNFGNKQILKNEYFDSSSNALKLKFRAGLSATPKSIVSPEGYKGLNPYDSLDDSLINSITGDVPVINDYTSSYLQGNRNSLIGGGFISGVGGLATAGLGISMMSNPLTAGIGVGTLVGGLFSTVNAVGSTMNKLNDINNVPSNLQSQSVNALINFSLGMSNITVSVKTISSEYKDQLETYWKAYGYAVNKIKVPNLTSRPSFNFIQLLRPLITGSIPQTDLEKIINVFESGITFWHNKNVGNYSQSN